MHPVEKYHLHILLKKLSLPLRLMDFKKVIRSLVFFNFNNVDIVVFVYVFIGVVIYFSIVCTVADVSLCSEIKLVIGTLFFPFVDFEFKVILINI